MTGPLEPWSEFNVAMAGATAALAGLLIVAMSVNVREVLEGATLPARAAAAIATLVLALTVCCLGLIPEQSLPALGLEVLATTAVGWAFQVHAIRMIFLRDPHMQPRTRVPKAAIGAIPLIAYTVGGALLLAETTAGLVLIAAGGILAVIAAVTFAWVVLVEVLR